MGLYSFFENKWYSVLEAVDRVIPITKLSDKIDDHFPSFLLFLIVLLILALGQKVMGRVRLLISCVELCWFGLRP